MASLRRKLSRGSIELKTFTGVNGPETYLVKRRKNPIRFRKNRKGKKIAQYLSRFIQIQRVV